MKKRTLFFITCILVLLVCSILGLANRPLRRPVTDLEFWIGENVDEVDFSNYHQKHGFFGGHAYYGSSYYPSTDEQGNQTDPAVSVIYEVTAYPDFSSRRQHITRITITDPTVSLYGLNLNSSFSEIEKVMRSKGFSIEKSADACTAQKGKFTFRFCADSITIHVSVTNWFRIQF